MAPLYSVCYRRPCCCRWFDCFGLVAERPLRLATTYLEQGESRKALSTIDEFLRDHPAHGEALSLRARALVAAGLPIQAIDAFERYGTTNSKEIHAWAQALLQLERWHEALPILEHLQETDIDRADVLHELAACRASVGDLPGAVAAAREFARQPGLAGRGNLLLGSLYSRQGDLREATAAWSDVLKVSPEAIGLQVPAAEFFLNYGRLLSTAGNFRLAAEMVERSLNVKESAAGFVELGNARWELGDRDAAKTAFQTASKLEPENRGTHLGLARLALADGNPSEAKRLLSILTTPDHLTSEVAVLLQQATIRLGDIDEATKWRDRADKLRISEQVH
jgi:tetratricopeptide (TPR) repeat protein